MNIFLGTNQTLSCLFMRGRLLVLSLLVILAISLAMLRPVWSDEILKTYDGVWTESTQTQGAPSSVLYLLDKDLFYLSDRRARYCIKGEGSGSVRLATIGSWRGMGRRIFIMEHHALMLEDATCVCDDRSCTLKGGTPRVERINITHGFVKSREFRAFKDKHKHVLGSTKDERKLIQTRKESIKPERFFSQLWPETHSPTEGMLNAMGCSKADSTLSCVAHSKPWSPDAAELNRPLVTTSEKSTPPTTPLDIHAPSGTRIALRISRGAVPICQVVGSVNDTHKDSYNEEKLQLVERVCELSWGGNDLLFEGYAILPGGVKIKIHFITDVNDVYSPANLLLDVAGRIDKEISVACPWVYVQTKKGWERRIEIIQNLNSPDLEQTQAMSLGFIVPLEDGVVHLQLREELEEISYLDRVHLKLDDDDRLIIPELKPDDASAHTLDKVDGEYLILRQGETRILTFRDERFRRGQPFEPIVVSTGYYIPLR